MCANEAVLCIAPEGKLHSLNEEIAYFIGEEHKQNYNLSVQLHLNAFNGKAYGCEAFSYNAEGLPIAQRISEKLGTIWHNRGAETRPGLYWTRKQRPDLSWWNPSSAILPRTTPRRKTPKKC